MPSADLDCVLKGSIVYVGTARCAIQLIMLQVYSKLVACKNRHAEF